MVHSVGQCVANSTAPTGGSTGDFESAGDVYQAPNHTGNPASGELTDLQVRPDGSAKLVTTTSAFTAADLRNSSGSALILHQDAGNLGAGAMNEAGKRVACGVIAAPASTTSSSTTTTSVSTVTTRSPCRRLRRARAPDVDEPDLHDGANHDRYTEPASRRLTHLKQDTPAPGCLACLALLVTVAMVVRLLGGLLDNGHLGGLECKPFRPTRREHVRPPLEAEKSDFG